MNRVARVFAESYESGQASLLRLWGVAALGQL